jgi:hypothetical protein
LKSKIIRPAIPQHFANVPKPHSNQCNFPELPIQFGRTYRTNHIEVLLFHFF